MALDLATNFDTCAAYDNVGDEMLGAVEINSDTQLHADADISARGDRLWPYGIVANIEGIVRMLPGIRNWTCRATTRSRTVPPAQEHTSDTRFSLRIVRRALPHLKN